LNKYIHSVIIEGVYCGGVNRQQLSIEAIKCDFYTGHCPHAIDSLYTEKLRGRGRANLKGEGSHNCSYRNG
jgi:hypothetical protein